jgi:hypothetical protein
MINVSVHNNEYAPTVCMLVFNPALTPTQFEELFNLTVSRQVMLDGNTTNDID